jgi:hypothetical protein
MTSRYVRQPRKGDTIDTGRYGECEVLKVAAYGRRLKVRDRLEREHWVERAVRGWWLRTKKAGVV